MDERILWVVLGILVIIWVARPIIEQEPETYLAIHEEVKAGDVEAIREYVETGQDLQKRDAFGLTPMHVAASYGQAEMVSILLEAGADPNAVDDGGDTPLDRAVYAEEYAPPGTSAPGADYEETIKILRQHGARAQP